MIYFDGTRVFGTVSYYLWKLMSVNRPDEMLAVTTEFPEAKPVTIAGQIGVGTWDATAEFRDIRVERDGQLVFRGEDGRPATLGSATAVAGLPRTVCFGSVVAAMESATSATPIGRTTCSRSRPASRAAAKDS